MGNSIGMSKQKVHRDQSRRSTSKEWILRKHEDGSVEGGLVENSHSVNTAASAEGKRDQVIPMPPVRMTSAERDTVTPTRPVRMASAECDTVTPTRPVRMTSAEQPVTKPNTFPPVSTDIKNEFENSVFLKSLFEEIDTFVEGLKADPHLKGPDGPHLERCLKKFHFLIYEDTDRRIIGNYFAHIGSAEVFQACYNVLLRSLGVRSMGAVTLSVKQEHPRLFKNLSRLRFLVWNNTDASLLLGERISQSGMLSHFVEDLKDFQVEKVVDTYGEMDETFETTISTLQNCSRTAPSRQPLRQLDAVKHLLPFLKCTSDEGKLQTLFTLANLVDETENEHLLGEESVFDLMFDILTKAWTFDERHRHLGFSVEEIVDGMTGLAKNDANKRVLVEKGAVPILMAIMDEGSANEVELAVKCTWELAFDKTNKKVFRENEKLIKLLENLKTSPIQGISKAAERALWVIRLEERGIRGGSDLDGATSAGHVMISYQWSDQKTVLKVRDSLKKENFRVWMDIDNMEGSTLQAMAEAVQNASVVLVCMSERYKLSQNCRSEAEYAFSLEKKIVPLIMQRGYKPDGWLGIIKGTKLFFDFSGKYSFEVKLADLTRELGQLGKHGALVEEVVDGRVQAAVEKVLPLQASGTHAVARWSRKDVANWLRKIDLHENEHLLNLSGDNITFLRDMSHRAPEFYFHYLKDELRLKSLDDLMRFSRAIDRL